MPISGSRAGESGDGELNETPASRFWEDQATGLSVMRRQCLLSGDAETRFPSIQ
jgi:hypothetical protein